MKKQTGFTFLSLVLLGIFSMAANGQQNHTEMNTAITSVSDASLIAAPANYAGIIRAEEDKVSAIIEEHFLRTYPGAKRVKWTKVEDGLLVSCIVNGQKTRAVFRENGNMNYSITNLNVVNIPAKLQRLIKNEYADSHIINALEINNLGNITHQVILENRYRYVTIKSNGDEIEVLNHNNISSGKNNDTVQEVNW